MTVARRTAISLTNLRLRVRRVVNDVDTVTANQRFADATDIDDAINDQLCEMQNELSGKNPGEALVKATMTYTASSDSVDLPAAVNAESIVRVEDYDSTTNPIEIVWVSPEELERYAQVVSEQPLRGRIPSYVYSLFAQTSTTRQISVRPRPSGAKTLRLAYVAAPFVFGAGGDANPLSARWEELIARGAAERLLGNDDDGTRKQDDILARLWRQFRVAGRQHLGPQRVTRVRRGIS